MRNFNIIIDEIKTNKDLEKRINAVLGNEIVEKPKKKRVRQPALFNPNTVALKGEDVLKELSKEANSIGFELPVIDKNTFFKGIIEDGVFPRKTFSTGHAQEKRYYLEARKIVPE